MTTQQLYLMNGLYLGLFVVLAVLTRATTQRIMGVAAGGAVGGVAIIGILALGEGAGWWHMAITWQPYFLTLLEIGMVISGLVFFLTWRIARRFGWRGLAVALVVGAFLGPIRDCQYMQRFPEWGSYGPGIAPFLAVSAAYVTFGVLGHAVMRVVSGPATASRLARRPWETAERCSTVNSSPNSDP